MRSLCSSFVLFLVTFSAQPGWSDDSISCDFEYGGCGWKDDKLELQWEMHNPFLGNGYMFLEMNDARVNDTGRLSSPWVYGSANQRCELQFKYYLYGDNTCQLSVYKRVETNSRALWTTSKSKWRWRSRTLNFSCTESHFQIVFQGKHISASALYYKGIDLDDIDFKQFSTPQTTTTTISATTSEKIKTTRSGTDASEATSEVSKVTQPTAVTEEYYGEGGGSGLSTGTVVGIALVVVVVVVVVGGVVAVCLLRRRARKYGQTDHWTLKMFGRRKKRSSQSPRLPRAANNYSNATAPYPQMQDNRGSLHLYNVAQDDDGYELSAVPQSRDYGANAGTTSGADTNQDEDEYNVLSASAGVKSGKLSGSLPLPSQDNYDHLKGRLNKNTAVSRQGDYCNVSNSRPSALAAPSPLSQDRHNHLKGRHEDRLASSEQEDYYNLGGVPSAAPSSLVSDDTYNHLTGCHDNGFATPEQEGYYNVSGSNPGNTSTVPSSPISKDTYIHLNGRQDKAAPSRTQQQVETDGQDVYSIAQNPEASGSASRIGTTMSDYEIVYSDDAHDQSLMTSAPQSAHADEPYSVLGENSQARAHAQEYENEPANHYDHLHDTSGEYNTFDADSRSRDRQRDFAADEYSHI